MIYFLYTFAALGFVWAAWNILIPIGDWILRMLGYGIFWLKIASWDKAESWQHVLRYICITIPMRCFKESGSLGGVWADEITAKGITWKPYFNYKTTNKPSNKLTKL